MIKNYFLVKNNGNILITSRGTKSNWTGRADILKLDLFSEEEAVEFLQRRTKKEDNDYVHEFANTLRYLPLALEQVVAYIDIHKTSYKDYLKLYTEFDSEIFNHNNSLGGVKPVTITLNISIEKIKMKSARQLLNLCSFFAPDKIQYAFFINNNTLLPKPLNNDVSKKLIFNDIIAELKRYSLIDTYKNGIYIYRLLQDVIRERVF